MKERGLNRIVRHMRGLAEARPTDAHDAQLVDQFVRLKDQTAFTTLVQRHGPMVRSVCLRELHDVHDAEDAFQATFMVLVRKAGTLSQRERIASWLHGVAYRVARRARGFQLRRRGAEIDCRALAAPEQMCELAWRELRFVLDEEIGGLPAKYRELIVLCYLEGLTYAAVAQRLGVPAGTVSGRLDRARDLLRTRLVRRGLTLSAGILGTVLAENAASAAVPPAWVHSTVEVGLAFGGVGAGAIPAKALVLAEGTLRSLLFIKLKIAVGILLAAATMLAGGYGWHYFNGTPTANLPQAIQDAAAKDVPANRSVDLTPSPAQKVVDRAILALGGKKKAASLKSLSWTMVWNPGEAAEKIQRISAHGLDQYRIESERVIDGQPRIDLYIIGKEGGWYRSHKGSVGKIPLENLVPSKDQYYCQRLGELVAFLGENKAVLTPLPDKNFGERSVAGILVEQPGQPSVSLYFDKASGLAYRSEARLARDGRPQRTLVFTFEDHREFDGFMHYTRLIAKVDDQPETAGHLREFRIHDAFDHDAFDPKLFEQP